MPFELTEENYDQYMNENTNALLDFTATWCGPCKRMKPDFAAAEKFMDESTNTKILFMSVDVDEEESLAHEYKINCMPTLILVKDGKIVERHEGSMNMESMLLLIGKYFDVTDKNLEDTSKTEGSSSSDDTEKSSKTDGSSSRDDDTSNTEESTNANEDDESLTEYADQDDDDDTTNNSPRSKA